MNSHMPSAAAAAEEAVAAVEAARTASCFSLWRLVRERKELRAEESA